MKLYVPIVTLSVNDDIKTLRNIKQGFKRTTSWNKYKSETTTQPKNTNLDHLLIQGLGILILFFYFHSKMKMMNLQEILLIGITCH